MEISTVNDFVFQIYSENEFVGNGFIIKKGYALTAAHVLSMGGKSAFIGGIQHRFDFVKSLSGKFTEGYLNDFTLIHCDSFDLPTYPGLNAENLTLNQELTVLAYTSGLDLIYLDSFTGLYQDEHARYNVGSVRKEYFNTKAVQYQNGKTAKTPFKGNSGAPVLNIQGEIVGLFYGMNDDREYLARNGNMVYKNVGYFIEASYITDKLNGFL